MASYLHSDQLHEYPEFSYVPRDIRFDDWVPNAATDIGTDVDPGTVPFNPKAEKPRN